MSTNSTPCRETQQRNGDTQMMHHPTPNQEPRKPRLWIRLRPYVSVAGVLVGLARLLVEVLMLVLRR